VAAVALEGPPGPWLETVLEGVCTHLASQGVRVAVCRRLPQGRVGDEAKDTGRYRAAGARVTALAAPGLLQVTWEAADETEAVALLAKMRPDLDLVLVEGFPAASLPWIGVVPSDCPDWRGNTAGCLALMAEKTVATAPAPVFGPGQVEAMARFILRRLGIR